MNEHLKAAVLKLLSAQRELLNAVQELNQVSPLMKELEVYKKLSKTGQTLADCTSEIQKLKV